MMELTESNYHSQDSNLKYMSVSQFKQFDECEAKTMAELKGEYKRPTSTALLVGSYLHAAFESDEEFQKIAEENKDSIFKKRGGGKYADFEQADKMIETLKKDPFAMFAMEGEKEKFYTTDLFGCTWKIKVDSINHGRYTFSDIKTTADLHKRYYSEKYSGWVSFVEQWGYVLQMALYRKVLQEVTGYLYTPYIIAVTKESIPNKAIINFDESRFQFEYDYIEHKIERMIDLKAGKVEPLECGKCEYCRSKKMLSDTIEVAQLLV